MSAQEVLPGSQAPGFSRGVPDSGSLWGVKTFVDDPILEREYSPSNQRPLASYTTGANTTVEWVCSVDERHSTWSAPIYRRVAGSRCPVCANRKVQAGVNDLASQRADLAAEYSNRNPIPADAIVYTTHTSVEWVCSTNPLHDPWRASPSTRVTKGSGCPTCTNRQITTGINDLATLRPDLAAEYSDENPQPATNIGAGHTLGVLWVCQNDPRHGTYTATPYARSARGAGCTLCAGAEVRPGINDVGTRTDLAADWDPNDNGGLLPSQVAIRSNKPIIWRCSRDPRHGTWRATPSDRADHRRATSRCPACVNRKILTGINDLATLRPDLLPEYSAANAIPATATGAGSSALRVWKCTQCSHSWSAPVARRANGGGCPACAGQAVNVGVNDLASQRPDLAAEYSPTNPVRPDQITVGSNRAAQWTCATCNHTWSAPVSRRNRGSGCPMCASKRFSSKAESEVRKVIRALVPEALIPDGPCMKSLGDRRHLDIRFSCGGKEFAVEYNGLYWHGEEMLELSGKDGRNNHASKTRDCTERGIALIHVWEDDWRDRRAVVVRMLAAKVGATARLSTLAGSGDIPDMDPLCWDRTYARSLRLTEVDGWKSAAFLEANHIQGAVTASRRFALVDHAGRIRALMAIRSPRSNARMKREPGQWEIQRYASLGTIPGGFTRLLAHAERTLLSEGADLTQWVTFAAADVSDGGLYAAAGFVKDRDLAPNYHYVGAKTGLRRKPKESFQRAKFRSNPALVWDESWTEKQAAKANGLWRVWDAGKSRYVRPVQAP